MIEHIVIGSLNADYLFKVHQLPRHGETVHSFDFLPMLGGKGGNQAAAIARLGGSVAMVGRVGDDPFGPRSIENLSQQGADTSHITIDPGAPTGTAMGLVSDTGENIIVVSPGANGRVSKEDVDRSVELFHQGKFLLLQFEIPLETVMYAVERAAYYPIQVILNPAPAYEFPSECLTKVDYLIPNESEASFLTGIEVNDLAAAEEASRKLLSFGVQVVIITLGDKGALLATRSRVLHMPAIEVDTVDPTACGDAFVGGFAVAMAKGFSLEEAIRYANCAGAVAVTRFGAQPSLPWEPEVRSLFNQQTEIN